MIGDTMLDLQSAKNAGIIGIGVLCGYGSTQSLQQHSHIICKDALAAIKRIREIL